MIKVLLVDDHVILREGLKLIFATQTDFQVVAEVGDGQSALEILANEMIDVVLLDVKMPILDGVETMAAIHQHWPELPVVVLTTFDEPQTIQKMLENGARGYLLKDASATTIFQTITRVLAGEVVLPVEIASKAFAKITVTPVHHLTTRMQEILQLVATGVRNKDIALQLHLSERTIKSELTQIYQELGVVSRAEAVAVALREQLI
ncbi:MAG TPA: response regulator transcription factor [Lactobacillaceae bacterium]|jgi:NarL family two-component system response regulator YdfI